MAGYIRRKLTDLGVMKCLQIVGVERKLNRPMKESHL